MTDETTARDRPEVVERALKMQEGSVLAREVRRLRALAGAPTADVASLVAKYRAKSAEFLEDWQDWDAHDGHERCGQGIAYSDVADELETLVAAAPEGVDAADEQERLREELGLEAGMRTAAVDELESLRRELWQLINADQLSDQDTLSQLRARDEAAKAVVDQAELTCAVVKRVLNADASEGTPIWEWTDEEAETGVREVLLAGEELAAALDDVHEGVDAADEPTYRHTRERRAGEPVDPAADLARYDALLAETPEDYPGRGRMLAHREQLAREAAPEGVDAADEQDDPWYCPTCDELTRSCPHLPDGMDLGAQGAMAGELTAAQAAIQRVREEHRPTHDGYCVVCASWDPITGASGVPWPCPTKVALDGDTTEEGA